MSAIIDFMKRVLPLSFKKEEKKIKVQNFSLTDVVFSLAFKDNLEDAFEYQREIVVDEYYFSPQGKKQKLKKGVWELQGESKHHRFNSVRIGVISSSPLKFKVINFNITQKN